MGNIPIIHMLLVLAVALVLVFYRDRIWPRGGPFG